MIGCSSLTLTAKDKTQLLSRTMDFFMQMAREVIYTPAGYQMKSSYQQTTFASKLATLGMGMNDNNGTIIFDGVNEKGLAAATLYFSGYAVYPKVPKATTLPVTPDKLVQFLLSQYTSVAEVKNKLTHEITLVDQPNPILKITSPLHYILTDASGETLIIEPTKTGLHFYSDTIGVMTNAPDYPWMETNLRNYLALRPQQFPSVNWLGKELQPFGQGSGSLGLPGDYTPPSRFVRVAFLKQFTLQPADEIAAVSTAANILKSVSIPQGAVKKGDTFDHTCYTAFIATNSLSYYFSTATNQRLQKVSLTPELLQIKIVKAFPVPQTEDINQLN
ncbi:choloylglycine hydrolase family protein [Liquorilactobacillus sicerae]|uniref:choloylglycine hydrolase family protein n=1 Tax=Liquorilactobacillus sicerae TaxID=1416943 RepID=UPI002480B7C9|nr:choloylglycine hydrolase family protein [Liquorilactobacillus sicerae]